MIFKGLCKFFLLMAIAVFCFACSDRIPTNKPESVSNTSKITPQKRNAQRKADSGNRGTASTVTTPDPKKKILSAQNSEDRAKFSQTKSLQGDRKQTARPGEPARNFTAQTFDGKTIQLSDYKGKYVLLDFWATWCRPCQAEFPFLSDLVNRYKDSDKIAIIGVSLDKEKEQITEFVQKYNLNYPHIFDGKAWENEVGQLYGVTSIPFAVLIGPDGNIVATGLRGTKLTETIDTLFKKKS